MNFIERILKVNFQFIISSKLKKNGVFISVTYRNIYPIGSQAARLHGLLKVHKVKDPVLLFLLLDRLSPLQALIIITTQLSISVLYSRPTSPQSFVPHDTFTFVKDIQDADFSDTFMVSYNVTSLFTNITLSETTDLAVNAIFESNTGLNLKLSKI